MARPKVIVNCAMSADGKIALPNKKQLRISSDEDMKRVFQLRNDCDGILVGIGAVLADDPKLTVKEEYVENPTHPIRIVLDTHAQTPVDAFVVNDKAQTIIFIGETETVHSTYPENVKIIPSKIDKEGFIELDSVLNTLYEMGIRSLLVEGGGTVIWSFIKQKIVDDLFVYVGPMIIGGKNTPTMADGRGMSSDEDVIRFVLRDVKQVGEGVLLHYQLP